MWQRVRTLGELQILTRASYVMLIFVPILAGIWPAVRVTINRYNEAVTESRMALESAAERLEFAASAVHDHDKVPPRVAEVLGDLNTRIDGVIDGYARKTIVNTGMPSAWAYAFFASLAITMGHLTYQAFAPSLVRQMTEREHIAFEVRRFVESPSSGQLAQAEHFANSLDSLNTLPYELEREKYRRLTEEETAIEIGQMVEDLKNTKDAKMRREITLIEEGAICEYQKSANTGRYAAITSIQFYGIGLVLIFWITLTQTMSVVSATWG